MKSSLPYQTINTAGEITAVVTVAVDVGRQASLSRRIMKNDNTVEQVAFVTIPDDGSISSLRMMGGELSVNGTVAGCYALLQRQRLSSVTIQVEALCQQVTATVTRNEITVNFPRSMIQTSKNNVVVLRGMAYRVIPGIPKNQNATTAQQRLLTELAKTSPAAGLVYYENDRIQPLVYVKATRSSVWEQACGSGSIAYALIRGVSAVRQPSGDIIRIKIKENTIIYQTNVVLVARNKSWYDERRLP